MKNVKNIFVDIDGTLVKDNKKVSLLTKLVFLILRLKKINIVLCSGRANNYTTMKSTISKSSKYIISSNGALVYNYINDEIIYESKMDIKYLKEIYDKCNELQMGCIFNSKYKRYCNKYLTRNVVCDIIKVDSFDKIEQPIYQVVIRSYDLNKINKISKYINKCKNLKIANSSINYINNIEDGRRIFLDVTNKEVSKGNAIKEYKEYFNLDTDNCMCFGDHLNDLSMFEECKYKIAMDNGSIELKEKSTFVTKSNNKSGVAYFIIKNIL